MPPASDRPERWMLSRAGIINVYQYGDETLECGGGRRLLRGLNGSGKSTAMNMLLPFLLDADTRRIDAAGEQSGVRRAWMLSALFRFRASGSERFMSARNLARRIRRCRYALTVNNSHYCGTIGVFPSMCAIASISRSAAATSSAMMVERAGYGSKNWLL